MPPTSFQCAIAAVQATSRLSTKTVLASTTSFRCVTPPKNGSFVAKTSPGSGFGCSSRILLTALSRTPTKDGMPAPEEARSPFAAVTAVPASSTS